MSVHLYTNGAWTDSGRIYRNSLNLFDPNFTRYEMGKAPDGNKISYYSGGAMFYIEATSNTDYTIKIHDTDSTFVRLYLSNAPIVQLEQGPTINYNVVSESGTTTNPETTISNTNYLYLWIQVGGAWYTEYGGSSIMLNSGSIALPYEPYNVVDWYANNGHGYSSGAWE